MSDRSLSKQPSVRHRDRASDKGRQTSPRTDALPTRALGRERVLGPLLRALDERLDRGARIAADPVELPRRYLDRDDQEVAGLISVSLAYGRADLFKPVLESILEKMGPSPARFAEAFARSPKPGVFEGFVYRFNRQPDLAALVAAVGQVRLENGSLGARFGELFREQGEMSRSSLRAALAKFARELREAKPVSAILQKAGRGDRGLKHLLPDPGGPGPSKRFNLFLRWMIRGPDEVDLGSWAEIGVPRSALVIPLDTHVHRVARCVGLTRRKDASWRTAEEITLALAKIDPVDPVRFDFALCHMGMSGLCPAARVRRDCEACPLLPACHEGVSVRQGRSRKGPDKGSARSGTWSRSRTRAARRKALVE